MGWVKAIVPTIPGAVGALILGAAATKPDEAISNLGGWVKSIIGFAPNWLSRPDADRWGLWIGGGLLTLAVIVWLLPTVIRWNSQRSWWQSKQRFTVPEAASVLCGISPDRYTKSGRAQALANDILSHIQTGDIPLSGERLSITFAMESMGRFDATPYPRKPEADIGSSVDRTALEKLAASRGLRIPWSKTK